MTTYGVTPTGFVAKPLAAIVEDLKAGFRSKVRTNINTEPESRFGQVAGIVGEQLAGCWEALEDTYAAGTPDGASGAALVDLAALTGTKQEKATPSTVVLTLTGTNGTAVGAGKVASVTGVGTRFATSAAATLATAPAYSALGGGAAVTLGEFRYVTDGDGSRVYVCSQAGNVTPTTPTGTGTGIADGTAKWDYVGPGAAYAQVAAAAEETGPRVADARSITTIETPVAGWTGVVNLLDADLGTDLEADASLRARREAELRPAGNAAADAIRTKVLKALEDAGVVGGACTVFENETDTTDGDGLPPHSIEVLVQGGTDAVVAAAIWKSKAGGIQTYGTSSAVVNDAAGAAHTVYFSRPVEKLVYIDATVSYDATTYPSDGDDQVKAAIVAWGDTLPAGRDVVSRAIGARAFVVPGVLDVSPCYIDVAPAPASETTVTIGARELAKYDTSRITITSAPATP